MSIRTATSRSDTQTGFAFFQIVFLRALIMQAIIWLMDIIFYWLMAELGMSRQELGLAIAVDVVMSMLVMALAITGMVDSVIGRYAQRYAMLLDTIKEQNKELFASITKSSIAVLEGSTV